jgi:hypothetical protein
MTALAYIWASALGRRRDRRLYTSMAFLSTQGVALLVGRGNCPFGPFQARLGDPVPMFELVLPPRAAKAAIPVLTIVALAGMALALLRQPKVKRSQQNRRAGSGTAQSIRKYVTQGRPSAWV